MQLDRRKLACAFTIVLSAAMFGCDHATKVAASTALAEHGPVSIVGDVVTLRYVENDDVAFSAVHLFGRLFGLGPTRSSPVVLAALASIAIVVLALAWWRTRRATRSALVDTGFAMAFAGALGNVVDRVTRGYVVDFIHVKRWPVFNVADILVVIGIGLVFLAQVRQRLRAARKAPERKAPE